MNIERLRAELASDPLGRGYAQMSAAAAAARMNLADRVTVEERFVNERTIVSSYANPADGEAVLQALEAAAQANAIVARAMKWMSPDQQGIDVGHAGTRAVLDALVGAGVLTAAQATHLKGLAERTVGRAEELGLGVVYEGHVVKARAV